MSEYIILSQLILVELVALEPYAIANQKAKTINPRPRRIKIVSLLILILYTGKTEAVVKPYTINPLSTVFAFNFHFFANSLIST